MPVQHVLVEGVMGRQVEAAAEPPDGSTTGRFGDEKAHVHVRGGDVRILRVEHQRDAHRFPACVGEVGATGARRGRQALAHHVRKTHSALFQQGAVPQHPAFPATALLAIPGVAAEHGLTVRGFDRGGDPLLQVRQVGADGRLVGTAGHGRARCGGGGFHGVGTPVLLRVPGDGLTRRTSSGRPSSWPVPSSWRQPAWPRVPSPPRPPPPTSSSRSDRSGRLRAGGLLPG